MNCRFHSARSANLSRHISYVFSLVALLIVPATSSASIVFTPFGPNGEGGTTDGQVFHFGSGGEVFELASFLNVGGLDLNGAAAGTSAQLSTHTLPAALDFQFSTSLSPDTSDLSLLYRFVNQTGATLSNVWFGIFVDAEIDVPINDYFNEAGFQIGAVGNGPADPEIRFRIDR